MVAQIHRDDGYPQLVKCSIEIQGADELRDTIGACSVHKNQLGSRRLCWNPPALQRQVAAGYVDALKG